jgi:glycine dehydrogenase
MKSMIGQGYYGTHTPPVILRNIFENPAWYTAYTPYQPEISQGRLEAILNFQQVITDLTGMGIANASMLDEGTAAAEAMTLIQRVGKSASKVFYVADDVLPQTLEVVQTRARPIGVEVRTIAAADIENLSETCFGVLLQYPGVNGDVRDYRNACREAACGRRHGRRRGRPAGPDRPDPAGRMGRRRRGRQQPALRRAARFRRPARRLPGHPRRIQAQHGGPPGRRHRRRPGQQGVPPGAADARAAHPPRKGDLEHLHRPGAAGRDGLDVRDLPRPKGLEQIARRVHRYTGILAGALQQLGYQLVNETFFDTLTVVVEGADQMHRIANEHGVNLRRIDAQHVGLSLDETTTRDDIAACWRSSRRPPARTPASTSTPSTRMRRTPSRPPWRAPAPT